MKTSLLTSYLLEHSKQERLMVSVPLLGWTFGSDNMNELTDAIKQLTDPTTILIRQFTNIYSDVPFKNNPSKFLPMKRIIAGLIDMETVDFLPGIAVKESFETCSETGAKLRPIKDYSYVEPNQILGELVNES